MTLACSENALTDSLPQQLSLDRAYWALKSTYKAVNLSVAPPYNTVKLEAVPYNGNGDVLGDGIVMPKFTTLDTSRLNVTEDGLLTAKTVGNSMIVLASLTVDAITHVDTILVKVTALPPSLPLSTFSIHPAASDSAVWAWGGDDKLIVPVTTNENNGTIRSLQIHYSVSDNRVADIIPTGITNANLRAKAVGKVWIRASTYAYGIFKQDSVEYWMDIPLRQAISVVREPQLDGAVKVRFYPSKVTVGTGGVVFFDFYNSTWFGFQSPGIMFDNPSAALGGDICPLLMLPPLCIDAATLEKGLTDVHDGNSAPRPVFDSKGVGPGNFFAPYTIRTWAQAGTYTFRDSWGQQTGTIVVKDRSIP